MPLKVGFFDSSDFMPHGHCFLWYPEILWLHVLSDAAIAIAYLLIPAALLYFIHKRPDMPFRAIFMLFGAFILLCAFTHLMSIWTLWHPDYALEGVLKAMTAIVSVATVIAIVRLLPSALTLPSPAQLHALNSELKSANEDLERMYHVSQEHRRIELSAVVDNALDGVMTISEDGFIESFNAACLAMYGYKPDEMVGQPVHILVPESVHEAQAARFDQMRGLADADFPSLGIRETTGLRKDGSTFPNEFSVSAFTIDGKRHFSAIIRDITKAKQADENRQILIKKLMESNTELERFAYVASHDMQEPIRMVMNFSEIISKDYDERLDDEGREYLKIVQDSATRLRNMVHDLLQYSRMGHDTENLSTVDMKEKVEHARMNLSELIRETGAELKVEAMPELRGNPVQLLRLLQNLITNAIKYQSPERPPVVELAAEDKGVLWQFSIRDNGIGIEDDFITQVFEPFRRLHNWEEVQGSGLGLSICRKIVERHGGTIWLTSKVGEGTTVYFTLSKMTGRNQEARHDQSAYS